MCFYQGILACVQFYDVLNKMIREASSVIGLTPHLPEVTVDKRAGAKLKTVLYVEGSPLHIVLNRIRSSFSEQIFFNQHFQMWSGSKSLFILLFTIKLSNLIYSNLCHSSFSMYWTFNFLTARFQITPTLCVKTWTVLSAWHHNPPLLTWLRPSGLLVGRRSTR